MQFFIYILFSKNNFGSSMQERLKFAFCGGFTADQCGLYDLKNYRQEYLSEYDWFKSRTVNKPFDFIVNNKFIFDEFIKDKIRTPDMFAVKYKDKCTSPVQCIKSYDDVCKIIEEKKSVIYKPICIGKGRDILRIDIKNDEEIFINNVKSSKDSVKRLLKRNKEWMICERITNHEYAEKIYPRTLNTIRIVVVKEEIEPVIAYAVHRFGTSQTGVVDNASKGGLVAKIDLSSGILTEAKSIKNDKIYYAHPDTKISIQGVRIPYWNEIKEKILEISKKLYFLDIIAWDIAVSEKDIFVIEGNSSSGVNILQLWEGQQNLVLGQFLKEKNVIR